jgi:hypothetical protein
MIPNDPSDMLLALLFVRAAFSDQSQYLFRRAKSAYSTL